MLRDHLKLQVLASIISITLAASCLAHQPLSADNIVRHFTSKKASATSQPAMRSGNITALRAQLSKILASYPDDAVSVSLIDLSRNRQYNFGSAAVMRGASTTKVITAIDYLHEVELGNASLDATIEGETARSLIQQMVQEDNIASSNDAWYDLLDYLSYDQVTDYGRSIGLKSFDAYYNTLTARDEATALQKLFEGKLLNSEHAQLLYSFMQDASNEDLIPAALPSSATVYDKYGYLYGYLHDAAIVMYEGHAFVLVIYTDNPSGTTDDYNSRRQLFHAVTKAALQYEVS